MAVIRVNKNSNYTVMSNHHLRDKALSLKAKGLLSIILSLPDGWKYSTAGLVSICKEEETAVKSALKELKTHGYVRVTKISPNIDNGGRFEYVYDIFETPQIQGVEIQGVEILPLEILPLEILGVENHPLYKDTDISNTDISNTDISNTDYVLGETPETGKKKKSCKKFVKPTVAEIREYCEARQNGIDADKFFNYYESKGWTVGKAPMKDWKACVITWELNRECEKKTSDTNAKPAFNNQDFSDDVTSFDTDEMFKQALISSYGGDFEL